MKVSIFPNGLAKLDITNREYILEVNDIILAGKTMWEVTAVLKIGILDFVETKRRLSTTEQRNIPRTRFQDDETIWSDNTFYYYQSSVCELVNWISRPGYTVLRNKK